MTRRKTGWTLFALTFALLLLAFPSLAKGGKTPNPNNGHGKITAVSAASITVTPKTGLAKTYTITDSTKVLLDGKAATAAALSVGQHAHIKSADGVTANKIKAKTHVKKHKHKAA